MCTNSETLRYPAQSSKTLSMVYISLFSVLIVICSWISIPTAVPFTLQTFAVFMAIGILGPKRALYSVLIYILLGAVGLPVFSGFKGGIGALLGTTGGYIIGFLFTCLVCMAVFHIFRNRTPARIAGMLLGLLVCYAFGTAWFMLLYTRQSGPVGLLTVLGWCVFPFILPDLVKLGLAFILSDRLRSHVPA